MCANYVPVTRIERLLQRFGVQGVMDVPQHDVFPMGLAPMVRLSQDDEHPTKLVQSAVFRLVPEFVTRDAWARQTYNARSETVDKKVTYRGAWAAGHRCIIPAESIYEPNYESGSSVRWTIGLEEEAPMGIAGIYKRWVSQDGEILLGMAMLTVNADDHPFMRRFHAPNDEKRMVVILDPEHYDEWLSCTVERAKALCQQWQGPMRGSPAPLPKRPSSRGRARFNDDSTGHLF